MPLNDGTTPEHAENRRRQKAGPVKRGRRAMKRLLAKSREAFVARVPDRLRRTFGPTGNHMRMLVGDHLLLRLAFKNRHQLAPGIWRSAQPLPHQIRALAKAGIRTIINLRGKTKTATYDLERAACEANGITMIDLALKSRAAPSKEVLHTIRRVLQEAQYPILLHCKSGADRAGFLSAIILHDTAKQPIAKAKEQLSLRYGHIRQADTGILDHVFERYLDDTATVPMEFWTWVDDKYDPKELEKSFKDKGWATRLVRTVLRRE